MRFKEENNLFWFPWFYSSNKIKSVNLFTYFIYTYLLCYCSFFVFICYTNKWNSICLVKKAKWFLLSSKNCSKFKIVIFAFLATFFIWQPISLLMFIYKKKQSSSHSYWYFQYHHSLFFKGLEKVFNFDFCFTNIFQCHQKLVTFFQFLRIYKIVF